MTESVPDTQIVPEKLRSSSRTWILRLTVVGLMVTTLVLWQAMRMREDAGRQDEMRQLNENVFLSVQNAVANLNETMYWNESILLANGEVSRAEFSVLNKSLVERNHAVLQVQWAPWVRDNERAAFEARARRDGLKDFVFVQPDADGKLVPSPPAEDYVVVYYAVARPNVDTSLGLNVIFTPSRRMVYDKSANTGEFFNTGVLKLFVSTNNAKNERKLGRPGFVIGRPVYDPQSSKRLTGKRVSREGLRGWVVLVVTLDELFAASVDQYLTSKFDIVLFQEDEHGRRVIGERSEAGGMRALVPENPFHAGEDDVIKTFQVADKTFGVVVRPTGAWLVGKSRIVSTVTLLGGLVFTALLAYFFTLQIKHAKREEKMNARIHAREALLHDVTANVMVAVYQAKKKRSGNVRVNYVSEPVLQLLGVTVDEVMADPAACYRNVVAGDTPAPLGAEVLHDLQAANSETFRVSRPNGERWIEHRALHSDPKGDGHIIINGYWADVTELKRKEMEIESSKEEAERANRMKSVFLANMSHELRTPLNAILGFARLLGRDESINEENRRKLTTINRAGQHLLALINDVLEISRIEAGRTKVVAEVFSLGEMLNEIEDMIRLRADDKKLGFEVERAADLPVNVISDAQHLKQILINLLGNAVKYTDHGHVRLRVSPAEGKIRFDVIDTGHGISKEEQENLFSAFYQTEVGIAKGEGTGLGLNISFEYAKLLGGELSVESQPGLGSVFTLNVPLPATEVAAETRSSHGPVVGLAEGAGRPRILVVDDNADNRDLVSEMLNLVGFEVKAVDNGLQGIDAFLDWHPVLILMDIRMPEMDGYEATRRIRALPGGKDVKIVALTASVFEEDWVKVFEAGCDKMAKKPVEEEELFAVMGELLGIGYRYGKDAPATVAATAHELDLSGLPVELRGELKAAADGLDLDAVAEIVERIKLAHSAELAARVAEMAAQYRFDRIAELCKL